MLSRFSFFLSVLYCSVLFSCSPPSDPQVETPVITKKIIPKETEATKTPPVPTPKLVIQFEFEGIPQSTLNDWVGDRNLKIIQHQLKLNAAGLPVEPADVYILSPRLIQHFIQNHLVTRWEPRPDLSSINPIFTSHSFDVQNEYAIPWRWTPMVLLQHTLDPGVTTTLSLTPPLFAEDPVMISSLQPGTETLMPEIPYIPDTHAYRLVWETFKSDPAARIWIPAACPLRNTDNLLQPKWTWKIPDSETTIIFDHALLSASSEVKTEALSLLNYLLSLDKQNQLLETSGYFPVCSTLGAETAMSPIPLPEGDWLNRSDFISLPAYRPEVNASPGPDQEKAALNKAAGTPTADPESAPEPPLETIHPDQKAY